MKVSVNRNTCEAHGVCVRECEEVFKLEDDVLEILYPEVPPELEDKVKMAVNFCPRQALSIEE